MASTAAHKFWTEMDEYHDLAQTFEENIERYSADSVTSRRMCPCLEFSNWCGHPLDGKTEYYKYSGPDITSI